MHTYIPLYVCVCRVCGSFDLSVCDVCVACVVRLTRVCVMCVACVIRLT